MPPRRQFSHSSNKTLTKAQDWEYPGAPDRGGRPDDGKNFVTFLKELDDANKKQQMHYVVSFTVPTSFWYLRHFDLKAVDYGKNTT